MRIRRPRKPKSPLTVKTKLAKRRGICTGCGSRFEKGEEVTYVRYRTKRFHAHTCVPDNVTQPQVGNNAAPMLPKTVQEANQAALLALENALVVKAKKVGITPEMEKAFQRYQKIKALAIRPATAGEEQAATRLALVEVVKIVF